MYKKQDPSIYCLSETHFRPKDTCKLKVRRTEKHLSCKWISKESLSSNTLLDKLDVKTNTVTRGKEGHYIIIKGKNKEDNITIINLRQPTCDHPNT